MIVETAALSERESYKLLISSVVPRPIAWVSSQDAEGLLNLAPFSYFQAVCPEPPTVVVSVGRRADGTWKDTALNAQATGEFVVNIVSLELAEQMNVTSGDYPPDLNEFEIAGLTTAPSHRVRPPRVAEAAIALECRLAQTVTLGHDPGTNLLLIGEVVAYYVRDDLCVNGLVDYERLRPVARLGGNQYAKPGEVFEMIRPRYAAPGVGGQELGGGTR
jgi:flavin reductase (DIM6/NTAB) family NADH-FMN oxidoreductase RutF